MASIVTNGIRVRNQTARAGFFTDFLDALRRRRDQRLAIARLRNLDDHLLRDIGMTRAGVVDAVRNG